MPKEHPQPAIRILRKRRIFVTDAARTMGVSVRHLRCVLRGLTRPKDEVRQQLPAMLGVPLEKLFTRDLLAKPYDPRFVRKSERQS